MANIIVDSCSVSTSYCIRLSFHVTKMRNVFCLTVLSVLTFQKNIFFNDD